jgi:hypothetical protein
LHLWYNRSFSKTYTLKGIESIVEVVSRFLPINKETNTGLKRVNNKTTGRNTESSDEKSALEKFSQNSESETEETSNVGFMEKLKHEKDSFINLLDNTDLKTIKTSKFWELNSNLFPNIIRVALILRNISSNSSFIERFFSISGVVCDEQAGNIEDDLIINRSLLKTNLILLEN